MLQRLTKEPTTIPKPPVPPTGETTGSGMQGAALNQSVGNGNGAKSSFPGFQGVFRVDGRISSARLEKALEKPR